MYAALSRRLESGTHEIRGGRDIVLNGLKNPVYIDFTATLYWESEGDEIFVYRADVHEINEAHSYCENENGGYIPIGKNAALFALLQRTLGEDGEENADMARVVHEHLCEGEL